MYRIESLNKVIELVENQELDLFNLLSLAIKLEINVQNNYETLSKLEILFDLRKTLSRLKKQEMEHENILRDIFSGFYPGKEPNPEISIPNQELNVDKIDDVSTLLKRAMKDEKMAEEFYRKMAHELKGSNKKLVSYLSYIEREHYEILRKEVEKLESGNRAEPYLGKNRL